MIINAHGNMFGYPADIIVNPVSCDGNIDSVLGRALEIIEPEAFDTFKLFCRKKLVEPGIPFWSGIKYARVFNMPVQKHSGESVAHEYLADCLDILAECLRRNPHYLVIIPAFADNALSWEVYKELISRHLAECRTRIYLFPPEDILRSIEYADKWHQKLNADDSFLMAAVAQKTVKAASLAIKEGTDVNIADPLFNDTPLHYAVQEDCFDICELLISHGADVNVSRVNGITPLHLSLCSQYDNDGDLSICKLLLDNGANPDSSTIEGDFPLLQAIRINGICNDAPIALLLDYGADVNKIDDNGKSPLHHAASSYEDYACSQLLRYNPAIDALDKLGRTPLHYANSSTITKLLLKAGAKVDIRDNDGNTSLHTASLYTDADVCQELLEHGADIEAVNNQGNTPLAVAYEKGLFHTCNFLLENGAKDVINCREQIEKEIKKQSFMPF